MDQRLQLGGIKESDLIEFLESCAQDLSNNGLSELEWCSRQEKDNAEVYNTLSFLNFSQGSSFPSGTV